MFRKAFASEADDQSETDEVQPTPQDEVVVDSEQAYWEDGTRQFRTPDEFDPEVSSYLSGAAKTYWTESLGEAQIQEIISSHKIPGNCRFLKVKQVNKPIFVHGASNIRTTDTKFQDAQQVHCTQVALLVQATDAVRKLKHLPGIKPISDTLRECILLAGETNQRLNCIRRSQFKPSIPHDLKDLCTSTDEKAEWLFGDNLQESLKAIKSENALKEEFAKKSAAKGGGKRKQARQSSGSEPFEKRHRDHRDERGDKDSDKSGNYKSFQKSREGNKQGSSSQQKKYNSNKPKTTDNKNWVKKSKK